MWPSSTVSLFFKFWDKLISLCLTSRFSLTMGLVVTLVRKEVFLENWPSKRNTQESVPVEVVLHMPEFVSPWGKRFYC